MGTRRPVPRQLSHEEPINPFTHRIELSWLQKLQVALMSVTIAPIRLLVIIILMLVTYLIAALAVCTVPEKDRDKPLRGWRKSLKIPATALARCTFFCFGIHWIKVRGRAAPKAEAPIVCCAPHTSFADILIAFMLDGMPCGVSRYETSLQPIAGMLTRLTEPLYVRREDPNSRQHTIKEIERRALGDWPQILIFPEGTTSNGSCLMCFKQGGFAPGLPVQPACIRFTNSLKTLAWTWDGPSALYLLWLTLCQFHNGCEIIYLPVYYPCEAEKADSKLFARNVRSTMAKFLGVPCTDATLEECKLKVTSLQYYPPIAHGLVELQILQKKLGYNVKGSKELLSTLVCQLIPRTMTLQEFAQKLNRSVSDDLEKLFRMFDRNKSDSVDFLDYVIGLSVICNVDSPEVTLQLVFKLLSDEVHSIKVSDLTYLLQEVYGLEAGDIDKLWSEMGKSDISTVGYDEFKSHAASQKNFVRIFKNSGNNCIADGVKKNS